MRTLADIFSHDHRCLEEALEVAAEHAKAGRWDEAAAEFRRFRGEIERHMDIEEQVLFPAVEQGKETPLTAILRKGHSDLRIFFEEIRDGLAECDAEEVSRLLSSVGTLLRHHDEKEEAELYPAAQERLGVAATTVARRLVE